MAFLKFLLSMVLRVPLYVVAGVGLSVAEMYSWQAGVWAYGAAPFVSLAILGLVDMAIFSDPRQGKASSVGMFFISLIMESFVFMICYAITVS